MQKVAGFLIALGVAVGAIGGFVVLVSMWIESRFGPVWVIAIWTALALCVAMFVGVLIAGLVQRWTLTGAVDLQAADDRGEIARANVYREMLRGDREYSKDVRRAAQPLARLQAQSMGERYQLEMQKKQDANKDSWYELPEDE